MDFFGLDEEPKIVKVEKAGTYDKTHLPRIPTHVPIEPMPYPPDPEIPSSDPMTPLSTSFIPFHLGTSHAEKTAIQGEAAA